VSRRGVCERCGAFSGVLRLCDSCARSGDFSPDTPTAPERGWEIHEPPPFCVRCDGYGVVLPVGSSIVVTCPVCKGKTADRPERGPNPEPAAAPLVDTAAVREIAALFDPPHPADAGLLYAAADELDTHHARRAELVALLAEWRAYAKDGNTCPDADRATTYCADALARILGVQP